MSSPPGWILKISDPRERTIARFMLKVSKDEVSGCWNWSAAKDKDGYGTFQYAGPRGERQPAKVRAHRVAYELFVGPIPDGLLGRHTCDNRGCVNPEHLVPGTTAQNVADRVARGRSARGDRHGSRQHPERWREGAALRKARAAAAQSDALESGTGVRTVTLVIPRGDA